MHACDAAGGPWHAKLAELVTVRPLAAMLPWIDILPTRCLRFILPYVYMQEYVTYVRIDRRMYVPGE
jgi:hypothetical protein